MRPTQIKKICPVCGNMVAIAELKICPYCKSKLLKIKSVEQVYSDITKQYQLRINTDETIKG